MAASSTFATDEPPDMPPIHPIFVHFPIALFTVAIASDLLGRIRPGSEASTLGFWCVVLAALGAAAAVAAGLADMYRADLAVATHGFVHLHRNVGYVLLGALVLLAVWRWRIRRRPAERDRVGRSYLISAAVTFALLMFQGWFGGELVYGLGAGVSAAGQGVVGPEQGQSGLAPFTRFTEDAHAH
jgi:uncharacterized membrane protein